MKGGGDIKLPPLKNVNTLIHNTFSKKNKTFSSQSTEKVVASMFQTLEDILNKFQDVAYKQPGKDIVAWTLKDMDYFKLKMFLDLDSLTTEKLPYDAYSESFYSWLETLKKQKQSKNRNATTKFSKAPEPPLLDGISDNLEDWWVQNDSNSEKQRVKKLEEDLYRTELGYNNRKAITSYWKEKTTIAGGRRKKKEKKIKFAQKKKSEN